MKKILYLITILPGILFAAGPIYQHEDPPIQREFQEVYNELKDLQNGISSNTASISGISTGDNLGNHVATKTITASYGINASTADITSATITTLNSTTGNITTLNSTTVNTTNTKSSTYTWQGFGVLPILQIVQATQNTAANYNTTSFTDTGITVTIVPKSATSKIFVMTSFTSQQGVGDTGYLTIGRNSSNLGGSAGMQLIPQANNDCVTLQYLDSPATTSSTVYSVMYRNVSATGSNNIPSVTNTTAIIMAVEIGF